MIVLSFACSLGAGILRGGAVEWFVCAILAGLALVSGLLPALSSSGLALRHETFSKDGRVGDKPKDGDAFAEGISVTPRIVAAGEAATVMLELKRAWPVPLVWIALEDGAKRTNPQGSRSFRCRSLLVPGFRRNITFAYEVAGLERGHYRADSLQLITGDWLGISAVRRTLTRKQEWLVLPREEQSEEADLAAGSDDMYGKASDKRMPGNPFEGIPVEGAPNKVMPAGGGPESRPFRHGDSFRHLDVRAAARGRGQYTKLQAFERHATAQIVIDGFLPGAAGNRNELLLETCIGSALRMARYSAKEGATVHAGKWSCELKPEFPEAMAELQRLLAYMEPDGEPDHACIRMACEELRSGGSLAVFSADWDNAARWSELAEWASTAAAGSGERGITLYFAIGQDDRQQDRKMRQAWLEERGIGVIWLQSRQRDEQSVSASGEGGLTYAAG